MKPTPLVIVLHGPSGVGKDSVIDLLRERTGIHRATSSTDRAPREDEHDGNHYHFLTRSQFEKKIRNDEFAEYAEVYGVPFSFIPCSGSTREPKPGPLPTRVRALEARIGCEICFPRLLGYRYEVTDKKLKAIFDEDSKLSLTTADIPTKTENAPCQNLWRTTFCNVRPPSATTTSRFWSRSELLEIHCKGS